jgi:hypothetical protein
MLCLGGVGFFGDRIMSAFGFNRRAALSALFVFALAPQLAAERALARYVAHSPNIRVDVAPLRANSGDPTADWMEAALPGFLASSLAGRLPPGATLTVRVDYALLGPNGPGPAGGARDQIVGEAFVTGAGGRLSSGMPIRALTSHYLNAFDQPLFEQANRDRIVALAQALADWLPSQIGL